MKTRRLTYDYGLMRPGPKADDFIVSINKGDKIGSVYHIVSSRLVKSEKHRGRYALDVLVASDLKEEAQQVGDYVIIRDKIAFQLVWYPRKKKK